MRKSCKVCLKFRGQIPCFLIQFLYLWMDVAHGLSEIEILVHFRGGHAHVSARR